MRNRDSKQPEKVIYLSYIQMSREKKDKDKKKFQQIENLLGSSNLSIPVIY